MIVDYKILLAKYIELVGQEEGSDFIDRIITYHYPDLPIGSYVAIQNEDAQFTPEEIIALEAERSRYQPCDKSS